MSDLTKAYEGYYADPNKESADKLLSEVKNYDFTNFDSDLTKLQELAEAPTPDDTILTILDGEKGTQTGDFRMMGLGGATTTLNTNGSTTSSPTAYAFGPNYNYWRSNVTAHLRNPDDIEQEINIEDVKPGSVIDAIERTPGPVWLSGRPTDFIFPTTDPKIADYILANADKIKYLTTYDTEPLMRRSVYHNDQMIDWHTGLNFRTCRFGNKHVLPTFAFLDGNKVRNMLNLCSTVVECPDEFVIKGFFKCPCGVTACNLEFLPHYKHAIRNTNGEPFYLTGLMNDLKGSYLNLQFLQEKTGGKVTVYVIPNNVPNSDYDHIRDVLSDLGFDSELCMNRYFMVGRKIVHFWQAERSKVKELYGKLMV